MATVEEKVDAAVHAAMMALGLSVERYTELAFNINDFLTEIVKSVVTDDNEEE